MGFFKKNKKSEKVYLDNSPEAVEARMFMESLKQTKEYKKHESLEKKVLKTKEAKDAEKLKKTAENSIDSKDAEKTQEIADNDTLADKPKPEKSKKGRGFFNKFQKK